MSHKTYKGLIKDLGKNDIFVFGSNPEGCHGLGAAKLALLKFNAVYGQGHGLQGNSYGLVTKNLKKGYYDPVKKITYSKSGLKSLTEKQIVDNIKTLYKVARKNKDKVFYVAYTANGNNLNGYTNTEMAKMFYLAKPIPKNIVFEDKFLKLIYT